MSDLTIFALTLAIAVAGFVFGRRRAVVSASGDVRALHSLPAYYGYNTALWGLVPALLVLAVWSVVQPLILQVVVSGQLPDALIAEAGAVSLVMADVARVADGLDAVQAAGTLAVDALSNLDAGSTDVRALLGDVGVALGADVRPEVLEAAQSYRGLAGSATTAKWLVVLILSLIGTGWAYSKTDLNLRARNIVESGVLALLIGAASIAILTTLGIVLSLIFNTVEFFRLFPATDFFFGTTWQPSFSGRGGASQLGIIPLIWGTLYISFIALVVAVPTGLFAAIYLSEYAAKPVRTVAKPMLELLAGIPTIVYGLFALLTVGPLLVDIFGEGGLLGVGLMKGGTAVMTAGLVMGIMLIPFVSSLSDDIINAVPQALRDGSLGLGATKSETIRQVVLPAALPGIVGAILLAASRAIGETMIVVLGAGAAARMSVNPFEAMTTVTAKIVSQLTGDSDFSSPEALVAFALGITLFVLTLGLNLLALYIVRKYREQYE